MSDQSVYFNTGLSGDTDERASTAAILPIVAGEKVKAAIVDRPLENLRSRTEVLREQTEEQKFLKDSDMRWLITGGNTIGTATGNDMPRVTWTPVSNKFTIVGGLNDVTPCIILQPIQGPKVDKKGTHTYAFTGTYSGSVTISTSYFAYEGGARHQVIWAEAAEAGLGGNKCSVVFSGTPEHVMTITVASEGTTTIQNLKDQFTAVGMNRSGFAATTSGSTATLLEYTQRVTAADTDFTFTATYDRELHYITKAQIDYFFTTMGKTILSGDTLGIYYPFMVDPDNPTTRGGRRQATPTSDPGGGGANTAVTAAQLFISSEYPEKIPQSIPICKRIGDDLIFIDGTVVRGDEPTTPAGTVYFGTNGYTIQGFGDTTPYADAGAFKIGVAAKAAGTAASVDKFTISAGMLQTVLEALQVFVNDKASLNENEELTGDWLQSATSAWYVTEASAANTARLLWRTGSGRPADGSITYHTISKYQLNNHGISQYESMLVTLTGGYLTYDTSWKINTPATGSGNVTVEIEICSAVAASEYNIRGSYRIYNATAATLYELLPTNVTSSSYTSGFSSKGSNYYLWGDNGTFTCEFANMALTATTEIAADADSFVLSSMTTVLGAATSLNINTVDMGIAATSDLEMASQNIDIEATVELGIDTPSIQVQPIAGGTTARTLHPHSHYYGIVYGSGAHGYINKVVDGLRVKFASGGLFDANKITITPGRAYVGGKLITIGLETVLSNVSNTQLDSPAGYRTALSDGNFFPATSGLSRWYGVWLRSNGSFRVGSLPDMGLHTGIPGSTGYMIPAGDVESGYSRSSYTLVDIVWCYDYDSSTAGRIRFAGMEHLGGGLHVYHQARKKDWSTLIAGDFVQHQCVLAAASETDVDSLANWATTSLIGWGPNYLPGIPTNISGAAYLGVYLEYHAETPSSITASLLHSNATLVPDLDHLGTYPNGVVSTSRFAPPIAIDPVADPQNTSPLVVEVDSGGVHNYFTYPVWLFQHECLSTALGVRNVADTVIYPMQRTAADACGSILVNFRATGFTTADVATLKVYNLGFFWDRYNPGGIY